MEAVWHDSGGWRVGDVALGAAHVCRVTSGRFVPVLDEPSGGQCMHGCPSPFVREGTRGPIPSTQARALADELADGRLWCQICTPSVFSGIKFTE